MYIFEALPLAMQLTADDLEKSFTSSIKFKSLAMCAFRFMSKYIRVKIHYISQVMGIRNVSYSKVTFRLTEGRWYFCHSVGAIRWAYMIFC